MSEVARAMIVHADKVELVHRNTSATAAIGSLYSYEKRSSRR
jgi:hypothetical protein